jgi:hypothetical protein
MPNIPEIYITNEQAQRLAAIACDTLAGMQIGSTVDQYSTVYVHTVDYDMREKHYTIEPDGTYKDVT